jgi:hypothetical protein
MSGKKWSLPAYLEVEPGTFVSIEDAIKQPELLEQAVKIAIKELAEWNDRYGGFFDYLGSLPVAGRLSLLSDLIGVGDLITKLLTRMEKAMKRQEE